MAPLACNTNLSDAAKTGARRARFARAGWRKLFRGPQPLFRNFPLRPRLAISRVTRYEGLTRMKEDTCPLNGLIQRIP